MKQKLADLAILGGVPLFPEKLHVGRPNIGNRARFIARINENEDIRTVFSRGHFRSQGLSRANKLLEQRLGGMKQNQNAKVDSEKANDGKTWELLGLFSISEELNSGAGI